MGELPQVCRIQGNVRQSGLRHLALFMEMGYPEAPYKTKESIQPKRYKAHLMGTTYVYDFPDLFRSALHDVWTRVYKARPETKVPRPGDLLKVQELILNDLGEIKLTIREPG